MEEYSNIKNNRKKPSIESLIKSINTVVDEHQFLSAEHIANGILENWNNDLR
jgi:hypothetical protein